MEKALRFVADGRPASRFDLDRTESVESPAFTIVQHHPALLCRARAIVILLGRSAIRAGIVLLAIMIQVLIAAPASAQGTAVITGVVTDASSGTPVGDTVVTVSSPALQGESMVVTDTAGRYRVPNLPPGEYTIRVDSERYRPYARQAIEMRASVTVRVNVQLLPETLTAKEVIVVFKAPTVDVGSTNTGVHIDSELARRLPASPPTSLGGASQSFQGLAEMAHGAKSDALGVSLAGTTSLENRYVVDNLNVGSPGYGLLNTPLSMEFVKEVEVVTGGYMPEHGNAIGGTIDVVTKSGSNELHGSAFMHVTPGLFEGSRGATAQQRGTISVKQELAHIWDVGVDVGGPILKDKLWFYSGVDVNFVRHDIERTLNRRQVDGAGAPLTDGSGAESTESIAGTGRTYHAGSKAFQYIGKLTWLVNAENSVTLSTYGNISKSGGDGTLSYGLSGDVGTITDGMIGAATNQFDVVTNGVSLKWSGAFENKHLLFDVVVGNYHESGSFLPWDGSKPNSGSGLSDDPLVQWRRDPPHPVTDFEQLRNPELCAPATPEGLTRCPVPTYRYGGPGVIFTTDANRFQAKATVTRIFSALGSHIVKAGTDIGVVSSSSEQSLTGEALYVEDTSGFVFLVNRLGALQGPEDADFFDPYESTVESIAVGAFVQDSWNILDKVTLNLGLRFDTQMLDGSLGNAGLALPSQWSPRVGVIYDVTQSGRSKIYANFARYHQSVPLALLDAVGSGPPLITTIVPAVVCNPGDPAQHKGSCQQDDFALPLGNPTDPNQTMISTGGTSRAVDPSIEPQSSDEIVLGAEFEPISNLRLGASYTHRTMNEVVETMSLDEGQTLFIGNPGRGMGAGFPEAKRDYDATTVYLQKGFSGSWFVDVSYTVSWLRGNWSGLMRPESGVPTPGATSDFDLHLLTINREGTLASDRTHQIKLFGAKELRISGNTELNLGLGYRVASGEPAGYLGAHPTYGRDEVYILPRGSGGRLPWVHNVDGRVTYQLRLGHDSTAAIVVDVFNIFNFQEETRRDQTYTFADVRPIDGGEVRDLATKLTYDNGAPFEPTSKNPRFGKPLQRQQPRTFRFGINVAF